MNYSVQLHVYVGGDLVLVLDVPGGDSECLLRAPDHKVGIVAHGYLALRPIQTYQIFAFLKQKHI